MRSSRCEFSSVVSFGDSRMNQSLFETSSVFILVIIEFHRSLMPNRSQNRVPAFRFRRRFQRWRFSTARQFPLRFVLVGLGCILLRPAVEHRQFGRAIPNHLIADRSDTFSMDHDRAFMH